MKIIVRVDAETFCDAILSSSDVSQFLRPTFVGTPRKGPPAKVEGELQDLKDFSLVVRPPERWNGERVGISFSSGFPSIFVPVPAIREIIIQP